jgi:hypothetical protein
MGICIAHKLGYDDKGVVPILLQDNNKIFKTKRASTAIMANIRLKRILHSNSIKWEME